jgi:hypothetical protein
MATNDDLHTFVRDGLARGTPRKELSDVLARSGWSASHVRGALAEFADVNFPIPVPRPRAYLDARDAFLHLILFVTLYISAFQLGSLIFEFIDRALPDPAFFTPNRIAAAKSIIRFATASLIVTTPIFLYVSTLTARAIRQDPAKRNSAVRRWLTYLTLFVASAILIGDVIALVYNALGGELTGRFLLKMATVGAIAGGSFVFYLRRVRSDENGPPVTE